MNKKEIIELVNNQLAIDLNCKKEDFYKEGIIYTDVVNNDKQRKCIRENPYVELVTMGQACVITVDNKLKESGIQAKHEIYSGEKETCVWASENWDFLLSM